MKNLFKKCYIMTNFADLTAISQKSTIKEIIISLMVLS
ncbi:hypothetical protein ClosIBUN13A_CONTIG163g02484 [Clostridium sp. IBUN13A]|nr:hypothetical protein ClosIBUN13A_CONTIG163g02484 [Clostridium sp. IBUN13A]